jgi:hypothetical protein
MMKNDKRNKNLLEQIDIQKKIIEELTAKIKVLEDKIYLLENQNQNQNQNQNIKKEYLKNDYINDFNCIKICDKCGKLFLFTEVNCCS